MAKRFIKDVLSVEQFIAYRKQGLLYREIGEKIGFAQPTVARYGRQVLPAELRSRDGSSSRRRKNHPAEAEPQTECVRCDRPPDAVDPESGLCVKCQRELAAGADFLEGAHVRATEEDKHRYIKHQVHQIAVQACEKGRRELQHPEAALVPEKAEIEQVITTMAAPAEDQGDGPGAPAMVLSIKCGNLTEAATLAFVQAVDTVIRQQAWSRFLEDAGNGSRLTDLASIVPPPYVHTDEDLWEYLKQIAVGNVRAPGGRRVRRAAREVLIASGRPVLRARTTRWVARLTYMAHKLVERDRKEIHGRG